MSEPSETSEELETLETSESPEILSRADSLMMRRRSFATPFASSQAAQEIPQKQYAQHAQHTSHSPQSPGEEDDLPILTEIVPTDSSNSSDSSRPLIRQPDEQPDPDRDEEQASRLAAEISAALDEQLASELPALLENVLDTAHHELRAGITEIIETALRDFMTQRKPLDSPLEAPDDEQ